MDEYPKCPVRDKTNTEESPKEVLFLFIDLGVIHNCHHFHERTQRTLGGGGQGQPYAFLNYVF